MEGVRALKSTITVAAIGAFYRSGASSLLSVVRGVPVPLLLMPATEPPSQQHGGPVQGRFPCRKHGSVANYYAAAAPQNCTTGVTHH